MILEIEIYYWSFQFLWLTFGKEKMKFQENKQKKKEKTIKKKKKINRRCRRFFLTFSTYNITIL